MIIDDHSTPLSSALSYLSQRLSVFPIRQKEKKPVAGFIWEPLQKTLPTIDQVNTWFDGANVNIAIITGGVSRLLAFDIDGTTAKSYVDYVIQNKIRHDTRDTIVDTAWIQTGGGGFHLLVGYNPEEFEQDTRAANEIRNAVLWRGKDGHSEIRLKSDGGYIVAPPSIHPSGSQYRFLKGTKVVELSKGQILDLVRCFRQVDGVRSGGNSHWDEEQKVRDLLPPTREIDDERIVDIAVILRPYYLRGQRHEFVLFLSGWLRKEGITLESARKVVEGLAENDEEMYDRLTTLNDTYQKNNSDDIRGFSGLLEILTAQVGSEQAARQILKEVQSILSIQAISNENNNNAKEEGTEARENSDTDQPKPTQTKKIAKKLIELVEANCPLLFVDQYGKPHVWATIITTSGQSYREVIPIESRRFETYVSGLYYSNSDGEVANKEALADTTRILAAKALFENQTTKQLQLRVAWRVKQEQDEIYYDLKDRMSRCISITSQGWQIISHTQDVLFRRFGQYSQVEPSCNYPQDILDQFHDLMHITDPQQRLLSKVLIISYFIPDIPHPILITHGEKGSVKTTYCKSAKMLADPSIPSILSILNDKLEFAQQLNHNYVVAYDNVKSVPYWFSDEVCKAVTGGGISKRQKFTDDDDIVYEYKRCVMINGINIALTEPDALDRSILLEFKRLSDDKRRSESEVMTEFERMKPQLLGYIMDILVKALQIRPSLHLRRLPRMADFAVWGEAIARAMGCKDFEFMNAYNANLGLQNLEAIDSTVLGPVLVRFASNSILQRTSEKHEKDEKRQQQPQQDNNEDKTKELLLWEGRAEDLLKALNGIAEGPEFGIDTKKARDWPKKGNRLTKLLRPMLSNLREGYGIAITIESDTAGKKTGTKNARWIEIRKVSSPSPPSSPEENQAQNDGRNGGDALPSVEIPSPRREVSSPKEPKNDAHFEESGGGEDGGDGLGLPLACRGNTTCSLPVLDVNDYVAFDLEWTNDSTNNNRAIYAAAFVDNQETSKLLHVSDLEKSDNPERELLLNINQELSRYDSSIGWYSTGVAKYHEDTQEYLDGVDSDLATLHSRCLANGVDSIVDFNSAGIPYIRGRKHIDLHSVFGKPMVQTTIFKNAYRTLKLDDVSKAVLSEQSLDAVGKYRGLTGKEVQSLPIEEQKKYVLRDAELVMQLSKHNNGEVLDAMKVISELTGLDFDRVCRTGVSAWWMAIFDSMVSNGECITPALSSSFNKRKEHELSDLAYTGGSVLRPKKGFYHNLIVVDVASLYPTMAILHNISFETINCECCKNNPDARIDKGIIKDCVVEKEYWICQLNEGAFPKKSRLFREERLNQKKLENNNVKQLALKILINSGYGVFGNRFFKYYDPRVAELITAYGRNALSKMQEIATNIGFEVVYGDTDSLFLKNSKVHDNDNYLQKTISAFQEECNKQLGIDVEHSKTYQTAIISDKKKHYVGWTGIQDKEPDIVGMEGDKNDRPKWINSVFRQTVCDIITNSSNNGNCDPIANLKKAILDLQSGNVNSELLKRSIKLSKNPEEYENENDRKRKIGLAIGARKGDVIEYFESDSNREGYSLNPQEISIRKYKVMLWKAVKDILQIAGYDIAALEQDFILNCKKEEEDHTAKPPRGVVGYAS